MYAANSFLRILRFVSNTFVGLAVGFCIGYFFASSGLSLSGFLAGLGL